MIRAHIRFTTTKDALNFIAALNTLDTYVLEDDTGKHRVDARSLLGALYFSTEHGDHMYLVNETNDGHFPGGIDQYRVIE